MSNKFIKGALVGVVGVSAVTTGYYTIVKPNLPVDTPTATTSTSTNTENSNSSSNTQKSSSNGQYKDGTYTGEVASTKRGDFQVSVEVSGGKITNINMLTQPTEGKSSEINKTAIPTYVQEAIDVQGTEIQLVSGASETYSGFKTSLQSALNKAK